MDADKFAWLPGYCTSAVWFKERALVIVNVAGPVPLPLLSSPRPEQMSSGMSPLPWLAKAAKTATAPTRAPATNDRVCWQAQRFVGRHFRHLLPMGERSEVRLSERIFDGSAGAHGGAAASVTRRGAQITISWALFSMTNSPLNHALCVRHTGGAYSMLVSLGSNAVAKKPPKPVGALANCGAARWAVGRKSQCSMLDRQ